MYTCVMPLMTTTVAHHAASASLRNIYIYRLYVPSSAFLWQVGLKHVYIIPRFSVAGGPEIIGTPIKCRLRGLCAIQGFLCGAAVFAVLPMYIHVYTGGSSRCFSEQGPPIHCTRTRKNMLQESATRCSKNDPKNGVGKRHSFWVRGSRRQMLG